MEIRHISDEYADIGYDLIQTEPELEYLKDADITIVYLSSDAEKKSGKKVVFGECEKIPEKYKWGLPCDFTITIYEPNCIGFTIEQLRILIFHELLHIGVDGEKLSINKHDLEDFSVIVERFGAHWAD